MPAGPDAHPAGPPVRGALRDGTRVRGRPAGVTDTHLALDCPGVKETVRLPLAEVRSVVQAKPGDIHTIPAADGRVGRLEADGLALAGRLVAGNGPAGRLFWRPDQSS